MVCEAKFAKFLKKLNNALLNLLQFEKEMGIDLQEMASQKRGERLRMARGILMSLAREIGYNIMSCRGY
jgi:chromosomal replication initiation ATPase DnaA